MDNKITLSTLDAERQHRLLLTQLVRVELPPIRQACFNAGLIGQVTRISALIMATEKYLKDTQSALDACPENRDDTITTTKETIQ